MHIHYISPSRQCLGYTCVSQLDKHDMYPKADNFTYPMENEYYTVAFTGLGPNLKRDIPEPAAHELLMWLLRGAWTGTSSIDCGHLCSWRSEWYSPKIFNERKLGLGS